METKVRLERLKTMEICQLGGNYSEPNEPSCWMDKRILFIENKGDNRTPKIKAEKHCQDYAKLFEGRDFVKDCTRKVNGTQKTSGCFHMQPAANWNEWCAGNTTSTNIACAFIFCRNFWSSLEIRIRKLEWSF